jgi:hypothetical protein
VFPVVSALLILIIPIEKTPKLAFIERTIEKEKLTNKELHVPKPSFMFYKISVSRVVIFFIEARPQPICVIYLWSRSKDSE